MKFGIDISTWQKNVDYKKAVNEGGVEFAIIRAGYGRVEKQKDAMFDEHYAGFNALNVPMGAYQYSYASDVEGAKAEARVMLSWLKGKEFSLPIFYDLEDAKTKAAGKTVITQMALTWCKAIEAAGYKAGIYSNSDWFRNYIDISKVSKYVIWCAQWSKTQPTVTNLGIWQFGGETNYIRSNTVPGFSGAVDQNYLVQNSLLDKTEAATSTTVTISGKIDTVKEVQIWLNQNYSSGLTLDGLYGTRTKTALVKALQKHLGVAVDGIYGIKTAAAVSKNNLKKGSKGNLVKVLQGFLVCHGYKAAYVDGSFGSGTETALKAFQKAYKLTVDGVAGKATFKAMCN